MPQNGCPVDSGRDWTQDEIQVQAAVEHGNHPMEESAAKQFWEEALEKEKQGLVELIDWEELESMPDEYFPNCCKHIPVLYVNTHII